MGRGECSGSRCYVVGSISCAGRPFCVDGVLLPAEAVARVAQLQIHSGLWLDGFVLGCSSSHDSEGRRCREPAASTGEMLRRFDNVLVYALLGRVAADRGWDLAQRRSGRSRTQRFWGLPVVARANLFHR